MTKRISSNVHVTPPLHVRKDPLRSPRTFNISLLLLTTCNGSILGIQRQGKGTQQIRVCSLRKQWRWIFGSPVAHADHLQGQCHCVPRRCPSYKYMPKFTTDIDLIYSAMVSSFRWTDSKFCDSHVRSVESELVHC